MDYGVLDHLLIAFLVLVVPVAGARQLRRLEAAVDRGEPDARLRVYRRIVVHEVLVAGAVIAIWLLAGRGIAGLGLRWVGPGGAVWWLGWVLALGASAYLVIQMIVVTRTGKGLEEVAEKASGLAVFLPHTGRELRMFRVLSLAAGIFEEIVFRGYAMAYLAPLGGAVGAVIGSSIVFGLAHRYQGWAGVGKTGAVGVVMGVLYLATGTLWAPMLLHAVLDVTSGTVARQALAGGR